MYHIVWITKYRKKVLKDDIGLRLREIIRQICNTEKVNILKGAIGADHVHVMLDIPPYLAVSRIVQHLKGETSRKLQMEFPQLGRQFWGATPLAGRLLLLNHGLSEREDRPHTVINNITNPVIERTRVIEKVVAEPTASNSFTTLLNELEYKLTARIDAVSAGSANQVAAINSQVAQSQRIDNLGNVTITNPTITGGSIVGSAITGTISTAINSALATIDNLTANHLVAVNATTTASTTATSTTP